MHWKIRQKQVLINRRANGSRAIMRIWAFILITLTLVCGPMAAFAESGAKATKSHSSDEKKKSLSFEDELVEGATAKPELFYLFQKKNFNFKRLIKLRENFVPEMRRTSEDVQRGRGSN